MNKEKVFAWIEDLEDMADQSDKYFVERTELYKENQKKDKEIERLNNLMEELEEYLIEQFNKTQDVKYCDDLIKLKELKGER